MSSGIDIEIVKEYYSKMSDHEIIRILTTDAKGLTSEALEVVKGEIKKRGLDPELFTIVKAQQEIEEDEYRIFDPEGCPVDEKERVWIENSFLYLLDLFGRSATKNRVVMVPEKKNIPVRFDGSEQSAYEALKIVALQMEVPFDKIKLDFYDEELRNITEGNPLGLYWGKQENEIFEISIAREMLHEPEEIIATLAHEIAHVKLLGENRMMENDEKITDMTTIFFGLGIFNANTALKTSNYGWSSSGYLTQMEWGYSLALFANYRNEIQPSWLDYLCTNVKADYIQSQRFIANQGGDFFTA